MKHVVEEWKRKGAHCIEHKTKQFRVSLSRVNDVKKYTTWSRVDQAWKMGDTYDDHVDAIESL